MSDFLVGFFNGSQKVQNIFPLRVKFFKYLKISHPLELVLSFSVAPLFGS